MRVGWIPRRLSSVPPRKSVNAGNSESSERTLIMFAHFCFLAWTYLEVSSCFLAGLVDFSGLCDVQSNAALLPQDSSPIQDARAFCGHGMTWVHSGA